MLKYHPTKNEVNPNYGLAGVGQHTQTHTHTIRQTDRQKDTHTDGLRRS